MKTKTNHSTSTRLTSGVRQRASIFIAALFCFAMFSSLALAQNVTVNPGAGSYPTLKDAFDAINAGTHTGTVTVSIDGDTTEVASAVLNASGTGSASYTSVMITPNGGARSISGSIAGPLIDLNGADNVTIDGTGGLMIDNSSATATASTIRFIADATNNTVQNCNIKGSSTAVTVGTIFFSTGTTTGNTGNIINSNNITSSGANLPANAIFSLGTSAAIPNSGITISGNNISDYFSATLVSAGINLSNTNANSSSAWTITNNKLFQTATRIYTAAQTHNGINIGGGSGYIITGNTIGFANASGTGTTNIVGNSVALTGTFPSSYTTTGTANATRYVAINAAFAAGGAASEIQGNTIAGFALYTSSGASTVNGVWCGINVASGNANIGTTTKNIIGAESGNGSIYTACTTTGGTAVGIYATSVNTVNIQNNTIGAVDAVGTTATTSGGFTGIDSAGAAGVFTINSNIIGNTTADNIRTGYTTDTGVSGGNLTNAGILTSTTGGTGAQVGIRNSATGATLSINSNTLRGWAVGGTTTAVTGITSTGAVTTSVTQNNNALGTAALGWVRYAFANSGALLGINKTGTATATTIAINTNDFQGIVNSVAGTQVHTYITYVVGATNNVDGNTFTNLNVNTTGSVTFLNHSTANSLTATGTLSVSNNQIVTGFNKAGAGGTVTFFTAGGGDSSVNGSTILYNLNNFSNVTLTGATAVLALSDSNGASSSNGPTKTISNNTFNNISTGTAPQITGISFNFSGNGTTVSNNTLTNLTGGLILSLAAGTSNGGAVETISGNTLSNFTAAGQVNALQTGFGVVTTGNITGNTITNISSSAATANPIFAIICSGFGTTTNISKNKIGNIQSTGNALAGSSVFGILAQTASTTYNITNNLVGDLRLPANPAANNLQGISIGTLTAGTTVNLQYNTVWLNESVNAQAGFGSSAVSVSTTPTVVMRDNILVNTSVFNTTGLTVAYRRSSTTLGTYGAASNNNDFYAGTPGANNLIFNDGTNSDQTIGAYKTRVASRDSSSFTENPTFLSTTARPADTRSKSPAAPAIVDPFLHIDQSVATQLESGGIAIAGITDDYDGDTRNVSTPDVGADEFNGTAIDLSAPNISYTLLGNTIATPTRSFTNVMITDATGVNIMAGTRPRVYYKKSSDADNNFNDNTNMTTGWKFVEADGAGGSPFSFTIDYSLLSGGGGVTAGDTIQYFVVAQDTVTPTPNVGINAGSFAATPSSVALTSAAFPIGGSINSYNILATISGTKTVGAGGGFDYPDLTSAVDALNNAVLVGPVVFELQDSMFTNSPLATEAFPLTINANSGSSMTNTVTFKPKSGQTVNMTGSASTALFILNGADWIIFDGSNTVGGSSRDMTINNTNTGTSSAVIWMQSNGADGATNNIVKNVNLVGTTTTATAGTLIGAGAGSSTISITSTGTGNNNNRFENNNITKTVYGIYSGGASAANKNTGTVITGNVMNAASPNNITTGGILVNFDDGAQITQNDIGNILKHDGTTGTTGTVFGIALGAVPSNSVTTFTGNDVINAAVRRNKINALTQLHSTGYSSFGIVVNSVTSGTTLVSNNMISGVRSASTASDFSAGIVAGGGAGSTTQVYDNSVSMTGSRNAASFPSYGLAIGGSNPTVDVRDNIFFNTQTSSSSAKMYAIGTASTTFTNMTSNYNDFFVNGTNTFVGQTGGLGTSGTDRATLAIWSGVTGTDTPNSISADPLFVSTADVHLSSNASPAANAGTPIGAVTVDFDGNSRSATATDIGADEIASADLSGLTLSAGALVPDVRSCYHQLHDHGAEWNRQHNGYSDTFGFERHGDSEWRPGCLRHGK